MPALPRVNDYSFWKALKGTYNGGNASFVVEGIPVTVEAAVADSLPVEVILGTNAGGATRKTSWFCVLRSRRRYGGDNKVEETIGNAGKRIELLMPFMLSSSEMQVLCTIGGFKPSASGTLLFFCQCDVVYPLSSQWDHHSLQCCPVVHNLQLSTQYSFVEAACTTAGCQTGGVANVTTLDSAPVGQAPPSSSIPIPLPCPSNGMLPSNPNMSSLPTPCTIESPALSPSQRCGDLLRRSILFYQINSVMTDFLGVKLHGGLPWLIFDVGSGPAVVVSNSTRTFNDGQWHTGYVVLFEQASNTFSVTVDRVHMAAITADHETPDGFDAVPVQNVGSTYIIVSWNLPTDSNGILINFSLYCNGALAGVLPLTVISYNTTGLLPFTLYMYMSSSHARRHCTLVGMGVISAAASLPRPYRGAYSHSPIPQLEQDVVAPGHKEHEEPLAVSIPSHHWMENYSSLGSKFRSRLGGVTSSQNAA
ncbi:hypothetical protein EMCRGX_G001790 [Ephydatia muelleri]